MKIAVNAQFLNKPNTGSGQYLINLLNALLEIDKENEYVLYGENLKEEILYSSGLLRRPACQIRRAGLLAMTRTVPFYARDDLIRKTIWEKFVFPGAVKKDQADLVWSPYYSASEIKGVKHIMTVHDAIYKVFPRYVSNWRWKIYYKLAEKSAKRADKIITISECSKKDIARFLNIQEDKIKAIYLGKPYTKNLELRISNFKFHQKYILYIGGFDFRKNVVKLIQAYKSFLKSGSGIDLVVAGKLPHQPNPIAPDIKKEVDNLGLRENVRFIGYVADDDLPELYKNAEVFVFPTLYEGFGLPVLEAMSYGCPVITSNNSSIPEIAGDSALLIDPNNIEDIANAIDRVIGNRELRQTMIQKGLENAQRFSWEKCALETLEVFNKFKKVDE